MERYDHDCIPANYTNNLLGYIQSTETNKTCVKKFTVSTKFFTSFVFIKRDRERVSADFFWKLNFVFH